MCDNHHCPECGDRLIHQANRGHDESSSAFGQWIHDELSHEMHAPDLDTVIYKVSTRILRVLEHKTRGKHPSKSQNAVLPLLAKAVQLLAATGLVHPDSGVFIVYSDPPYDSASVQQVEGWAARRAKMLCGELTGQPWRDFMQGEAMDVTRRAA